MKFIPHNTGIPRASVCFFKDGDKICCVNGKFKNLQESPAGFGNNFEEAFADLIKEMKKNICKQVEYRRANPVLSIPCWDCDCDGVMHLNKGAGSYVCDVCGKQCCYQSTKMLKEQIPELPIGFSMTKAKAIILQKYTLERVRKYIEKTEFLSYKGEVGDFIKTRNKQIVLMFFRAEKTTLQQVAKFYKVSTTTASNAIKHFIWELKYKNLIKIL